MNAIHNLVIKHGHRLHTYCHILLSNIYILCNVYILYVCVIYITMCIYTM